MTTVLAVDGNALAHRAFHATEPGRRSGAFVTGGLLRLVASTWSHGPFDGLLVALDDPRHSRRREIYAGYKAHREEKDPRLEAALDRLPGHLRDCGIPVASADGAEADDLLAAVAHDTAERGWPCTVLSSDRDLLALVSETVTMLRPRGSMTRLKAYRPDDVVAEFGIRPDQYADYAALRGDPSDGLDGVDGVGPKTAARLVRDYGSVPGIYAALSSLPPRLEAALRVDRTAVERNLRLMAPLTDLGFDLPPAVADGVDLDRLGTTLDGLELAGTAAAFRRAVTAPPAPPRPPPPTEDPGGHEVGPTGDPTGPSRDPTGPSRDLLRRLREGGGEQAAPDGAEQVSLFP